MAADYTPRQGQFLAFIYYYTKLNGVPLVAGGAAVVLVVAGGMFALSRLVGRVVLVQRMGRVRRTARGAPSGEIAGSSGAARIGAFRDGALEEPKRDG